MSEGGDWHEGIRNRNLKLAELPVLKEIKSIEEVRDPELVVWCMDKLDRGMSMEELRRSLGLGVASVDRRWKELRRLVMDNMLPGSDDDSLIMVYTEQQAEIKRIEELIEEYDRELKSITDDKARASLLKTKLDAHIEILEQKQKKFDNYATLKKIRASSHTKNLGVQIIIKTSTPRPKKMKTINEPD